MGAPAERPGEPVVAAAVDGRDRRGRRGPQGADRFDWLLVPRGACFVRQISAADPRRPFQRRGHPPALAGSPPYVARRRGTIAVAWPRVHTPTHLSVCSAAH